MRVGPSLTDHDHRRGVGVHVAHEFTDQNRGSRESGLGVHGQDADVSHRYERDRVGPREILRLEPVRLELPERFGGGGGPDTIEREKYAAGARAQHQKRIRASLDPDQAASVRVGADVDEIQRSGRRLVEEVELLVGRGREGSAGRSKRPMPDVAQIIVASDRGQVRGVRGVHRHDSTLPGEEIRGAAGPRHLLHDAGRAKGAEQRVRGGARSTEFHPGPRGHEIGASGRTGAHRHRGTVPGREGGRQKARRDDLAGRACVARRQCEKATHE